MHLFFRLPAHSAAKDFELRVVQATLSLFVEADNLGKVSPHHI